MNLGYLNRLNMVIILDLSKQQNILYMIRNIKTQQSNPDSQILKSRFFSRIKSQRKNHKYSYAKSSNIVTTINTILIYLPAIKKQINFPKIIPKSNQKPIINPITQLSNYSSNQYQTSSSPIKQLIHTQQNRPIQQQNSYQLKIQILKILTSQDYLSQKQKSQYIQSLIRILKQQIQLFKKLESSIIYSLFMTSQILYYQKHQIIYRALQKAQKFYIVLTGKVYLINKKDKFKKICRPGEMFGEQIMLFQKQSRPLDVIIKWQHGIKPRLQTAKTLSNSYLLSIQQGNYNKISRLINRCGMKSMLNVLDSMIIRNYNDKQFLRHENFY